MLLLITLFTICQSFKIGFTVPDLECPECLPIFNAAIDELNANLSSPKFVGYVLNTSSTERSSQKLKNFDHLISNRQCSVADVNPMGLDVDVIIGDLYSSNVNLLAPYAEIYQTPMIGYGATNDDLAITYPYFNRVNPADKPQTVQLAKIVEQIWSRDKDGMAHIAILSSNEPFGTNYANQFTNAVHDLNVRIVTRQVFNDNVDVNVQLNALKSSGAKIVLLAATGPLALQILKLVNAEMEVTWVIADLGFLMNGDDLITHEADGALAMFPAFHPSTKITNVLFPMQNFNPFVYYIWDAVRFAGNALLQQDDNLQDVLLNITLYDGLTGDVTLDSDGERSSSAHNIFNFYNGNAKIVGISDEANMTLDLEEIIWVDGTNEIFSDGDFSVHSEKVNLAKIIVPIFVAFAGILIALMIMFNRYRNKMKRKITVSREHVAKLTEMKTPIKDSVHASSNAEWFFEDDSNNWSKQLVSDDIEEEFQNNENGSCDFSFNGVSYTIDFRKMIQKRNDQLGTERKVLRKTSQHEDRIQPQERQRPDDLQTFLILKKGQLIKINNNNDKRKDGWWEGTIVNQPGAIAGWFHEDDVEDADLETVRKFYESTSSELPNNWTNKDKMDDSVECYVVKPNTPEYKKVKDAFHKNNSDYVIVSIERIQNKNLYQQFSVFANMYRHDHNLFKEMMFHGTHVGCYNQIMQQGFNRSFCGRNMCAYGKGVYFAINPKYSCSDTYSSPEPGTGLKRLFVCSVAHGTYCRGKNDALTPDIIPGSKTNQTYDSTVDNLDNPSMFVVYKDGQVYPNYLVTFKEK